MKTYISYLVIALLMAHTLTAQVKIGDNPQNLNNSSVLELESTSRVLVITRVSDVQMNAISPLRGALVYNTDHDCLHYYDGDRWVNICEELDNSFTVSTLAEYMRPINPNALDDTVVITETPNPDGSINYNFEVGIINGANIGASAINGDSKIQGNSITSRLLADQSVGTEHFQDGGVEGDMFIWDWVWDPIVGAMVLKWTLVNETDLRITEKDSIIGNEVLNATIGGSLIRSGGGTDADPYTLDVSDGGIGNAELGTDAVTTDKILDGTIGTADIAPDAITTDKIATGAVESTDIAADAVNAATINVDVAGNGLIQNATTGALDVNVDDSTIEINTDLLRIKPSATDGDVLTTIGGAVSWQAPAVVAMGKVGSDGIPIKINGATVRRPSTGNYTVTFGTPRPDANYIIQLTLLEAAPGTSIQVQNQTSAGFDVVIVSIEPGLNRTPLIGIETLNTSPEVDDHTHTGFTTDSFIIVDNLIFPQVNANWYFTITDF